MKVQSSFHLLHRPKFKFIYDKINETGEHCENKRLIEH
jgi:hypothetical protein